MVAVLGLVARAGQAWATAGAMAPAVTSPVLVVPGPVRSVVASPFLVAAVLGVGEVLILGPDGRVRGRIDDRANSPPAGLRHGSGRARAGFVRDGFTLGASVAADDDFSDAYDPDGDLEDSTSVIVDDVEGPGPRRRGRARPERAVRPRSTVIAAGGTSVWVARADGLWRFDAPGGDVSAGATDGEPGEDLGVGTRMDQGARGAWRALAASGSGTWLAGVRDGWLCRSGDRGVTFETLTPVREDALAAEMGLAIDDDGTAYFADERGVLTAARGSDAPTMAFTSGATDVAVCGGRAWALGHARIRALDDLGPAGSDPAPSATDELAAPEGARRLACSGPGLAAYGVGLWTRSSLQGPWTPRNDVPSGPIGAAAIAGGRVWVATPAGLWALPLEPPPALALAKQAWAPHLDLGPPEEPTPWHRAGWWVDALPRIDLGVALARSSERRDLRGFILATFSFGRDRTVAAERRHLAGEAAWRRRATNDAAIALAMPPPPSSNGIDLEERAALARALETAP